MRSTRGSHTRLALPRLLSEQECVGDARSLRTHGRVGKPICSPRSRGRPRFENARRVAAIKHLGRPTELTPKSPRSLGGYLIGEAGSNPLDNPRAALELILLIEALRRKIDCVTILDESKQGDMVKVRDLQMCLVPDFGRDAKRGVEVDLCNHCVSAGKRQPPTGIKQLYMPVSVLSFCERKRSALVEGRAGPTRFEIGRIRTGFDVPSPAAIDKGERRRSACIGDSLQKACKQCRDEHSVVHFRKAAPKVGTREPSPGTHRVQREHPLWVAAAICRTD
jgi:hypothetical protein